MLESLHHEQPVNGDLIPNWMKSYAGSNQYILKSQRVITYFNITGLYS